MKQEIIIDKPPIFDQIVAVFPEAAQPGILFSWGDKVYNPSGFPIPPQLVAHEAAHGDQQSLFSVDGDTEFAQEESIRLWWKKYLADPAFRLDEEIIGHRAEYKSYCGLVKDREQRARYLHRMALRLAGPLYKGGITYMEARRAISK